MGESSHFHLALSGPPANLTVTLSLLRPALFINLCRIPQSDPENCPSHVFHLSLNFWLISFFFFFLFYQRTLHSIALNRGPSTPAEEPTQQLCLTVSTCLLKEGKRPHRMKCVYVGCVWQRERGFVFPLRLTFFCSSCKTQFAVVQTHIKYDKHK